MRFATTQEIRDIARSAFVKVTGCCYDYKMSWTDKDTSSKGENLRRISFMAPDVPAKAQQIIELMDEALERRNLFVMGLNLTESGYIRCRAEKK
jgi:hypothetical protein